MNHLTISEREQLLETLFGVRKWTKQQLDALSERVSLDGMTTPIERLIWLFNFERNNRGNEVYQVATRKCAVKQFFELAKDAPNLPLFHLSNLIDRVLSSHEQQSLFTYLRDAVERFPSDVSVLKNCAVALRKTSPAEAFSLFLKVLQLEPQDFDAGVFSATIVRTQEALAPIQQSEKQLLLLYIKNGLHLQSINSAKIICIGITICLAYELREFRQLDELIAIGLSFCDELLANEEELLPYITELRHDISVTMGCVQYEHRQLETALTYLNSSVPNKVGGERLTYLLPSLKLADKLLVHYPLQVKKYLTDLVMYNPSYSEHLSLWLEQISEGLFPRLLGQDPLGKEVDYGPRGQ